MSPKKNQPDITLKDKEHQAHKEKHALSRATILKEQDPERGRRNAGHQPVGAVGHVKRINKSNTEQGADPPRQHRASKELIEQGDTDRVRHHARRCPQEDAKHQQLNDQPKVRSQKVSLKVLGRPQHDADKDRRPEVQKRGIPCDAGRVGAKHDHTDKEEQEGDHDGDPAQPG